MKSQSNTPKPFKGELSYNSNIALFRAFLISQFARELSISLGSSIMADGDGSNTRPLKDQVNVFMGSKRDPKQWYMKGKDPESYHLSSHVLTDAFTQGNILEERRAAFFIAVFFMGRKQGQGSVGAISAAFCFESSKKTRDNFPGSSSKIYPIKANNC